MATLRFRINAGALVRRQARRQIETYCWDQELKLTMRESKGLLESILYIEIESPNNAAIVQAQSDLTHWLARNEK